MLAYVSIAWYLVHQSTALRSLLKLRPFKALLAFGAMAAKARAIFSFMDSYVQRFPDAVAGAIVLGGLAGSGGSLFVAFERKMRLGSRTPSEFSAPGWGFKSAYLAAFLYYITTDPANVLRTLPVPMRYTLEKDDARYIISLALCVHAALETLWGRHINPMFLLERLFYTITRVDRTSPVDQPPTFSMSDISEHTRLTKSDMAAMSSSASRRSGTLHHRSRRSEWRGQY